MSVHGLGCNTDFVFYTMQIYDIRKKPLKVLYLHAILYKNMGLINGYFAQQRPLPG